MGYAAYWPPAIAPGRFAAVLRVCYLFLDNRFKGFNTIVNYLTFIVFYFETFNNNSSGVTNACSPVAIFFSVNFPSAISVSPARTTKGICFALA